MRITETLDADERGGPAQGGMAPSGLDWAFGVLTPVRGTTQLAAGQEVFGQGQPADYVYKVLAGTVRCYRLLSDGRRQICEFALPGDYLGLEALVEHQVTAEAVGPVVLLSVRRSALTALAKTEADLARELWERAISAAHRSQEHASILARLSASERVAAFLLAMARRLGAAAEMQMPMTRQDIADYLGLTIHTVSRTLAQLEDQGLIDARSSRRVRLNRTPALAELCA